MQEHLDTYAEETSEQGIKHSTSGKTKALFGRPTPCNVLIIYSSFLRIS
jgi:hypothetical protein